jgi:uncharacterized protein with PIN domain
MLGGLARWLRAAGYDSSWRADIDDWELVRLARAKQRVLLTCDTGIFRIGIVRDGDLPALLLPPGLSKDEQLAFVLRELDLPLREHRCMACGGHLAEVPKEQVRGRVLPRSFEWVDHFFECAPLPPALLERHALATHRGPPRTGPGRPRRVRSVMRQRQRWAIRCRRRRLANTAARFFPPHVRSGHTVPRALPCPRLRVGSLSSPGPAGASGGPSPWGWPGTAAAS